ncbi:LacI family DNA-binding transcriptional regulator [Homoserinibacter sp. GY 40078]|uniref:LacI family DNA-binding transcriptional regulator n=1 Tax=Homoserinibacter sp. GY 40078 TaxID=2603275 RepID=UPI0011C70BEA|nr:LacI family DNA-binding transcriptional regulator [Homoserinibacter sp. GY 40078]TXK18834.1 LacI family transcriptional regulator [Homoserinibacter sp. GY 40078]
MSDTANTRPTLSAVAARAGVSASTASLVFSGSGPVAEATRERVLEAASALGYAGPNPTARSLRRGRTGIVGVVTEDRLGDAFRDPINLALLDGLGDELADEGLGLLVLPWSPGSRADLAAAPMDAAVLLGCSADLAGSVELLRRRRIPLIAIEAPPLDGVVPIDLDNADATRRGAELLRELGHERVALVTLPLDIDRLRAPLTPEREAEATAYTAMERIRGAREVFPDATGVSAGASTVAEGYVAGRALLDVPGDRPTAIIAQSDLLAVGAIRAAEELGLAVPTDLSVLGFDGARLDGITSHVLTTLAQPAVEKGRAAGRAVRASLVGEMPAGVALGAELRRGETVAPPRA